MTPQSTSAPPITLIDSEKLVSEFKNPLLLNEYPPINLLTKPLNQILWVLRIIEEKFSILGHVHVDMLSEILIEALLIPLEPNAVTGALSRAGNKIHKKRAESGETIYKIMNKGKQHLDDIYGDSEMKNNPRDIEQMARSQYN